MKRSVFVLLLLCAFVLCGCEQYETVEGIELPFTEGEIETVETYSYTDTPTGAIKKTVTDRETIRYLYETLSGIPMQTGPIEAKTGADVSCFRFNLTDGSAFEVIYEGYGVKDGLLSFPSLGKTYHVRADINGVWANLSGEALPAEPSEVPQPLDLERTPESQAPTAIEYTDSPEISNPEPGEIITESFSASDIVLIPDTDDAAYETLNFTGCGYLEPYSTGTEYALSEGTYSINVQVCAWSTSTDPICIGFYDLDTGVGTAQVFTGGLIQSEDGSGSVSISFDLDTGRYLVYVRNMADRNITSGLMRYTVSQSIGR